MESEGRPMAVTELPWLYKAKKEIIKVREKERERAVA